MEGGTQAKTLLEVPSRVYESGTVYAGTAYRRNSEYRLYPVKMRIRGILRWKSPLQWERSGTKASFNSGPCCF
jgi:hypothetical protein